MKIKIKTEPSPYSGDDGHFRLPYRARLIVAGSNANGWGVGGWDKNGTGRIIDHGPIVQGPHAYAFGLATVIDNHGGQKYDDEYRAEPGDVISTPAGDFVIGLCKRGYVTLKHVA